MYGRRDSLLCRIRQTVGRAPSTVAEGRQDESRVHRSGRSAWSRRSRETRRGNRVREEQRYGRERARCLSSGYRLKVPNPKVTPIPRRASGAGGPPLASKSPAVVSCRGVRFAKLERVGRRILGAGSIAARRWRRRVLLRIAPERRRPSERRAARSSAGGVSVDLRRL